MKKTLFILFVIFFSCGKEKKVTNESKQDTRIENRTEKVNEVIECDSTKILKPKSLLICKIEALEKLKNNYQLKSSDKNIGFEKTTIYRELKHWNESEYYGNEKTKAIFKKINELKKYVQEVNSCRIKGTNDLGGKTYPRANIVEIIFNTNNCAAEFMNLMGVIKNEGSLMERIDKSPNSVFQENNIVYYISSGGWFMMEFYDEIEKNMKNKNCP